VQSLTSFVDPQTHSGSPIRNVKSKDLILYGQHPMMPYRFTRDLFLNLSINGEHLILNRIIASELFNHDIHQNDEQ